jgi:chromosome partitioning protein
MIILVANEKGGTGKTTLAVNLAVRHLNDGKTVLLIDADPQQSASAWAELRQASGIEPCPVTVSKTGASLDKDVKALAPKFDMTLIDTGGRDSVEMRKGMLIADLVLVPVQASQFDVWVLEKMAKLIEDAQGFNEGLKSALVVNRAPTNPAITEEEDLRNFLSELPGMTPLKTSIKERIAWRKAAKQGLAIGEIQPHDLRAESELEAIFQEIMAYLAIQ